MSGYSEQVQRANDSADRLPIEPLVSQKYFWTRTLRGVDQDWAVGQIAASEAFGCGRRQSRLVSTFARLQIETTLASRLLAGHPQRPFLPRNRLRGLPMWSTF